MFRLQTKYVILREMEHVNMAQITIVLVSNLFSRNDKVYIFRMMCCLDGIYLCTETED